MDQEHIILAIFEFAVLLFSLSLHEAAHAWMANRLGDPTARMLGRVTLNPIKHIDLLGTVILPIIMLVVNTGFLFGWAKPTPVTTANFKNITRDDILTTVAGPASNVLAAIGSHPRAAHPLPHQRQRRATSFTRSPPPAASIPRSWPPAPCSSRSLFSSTSP